MLGPLRHPKPLTPSDLHSMLEQEQEAMVCTTEYNPSGYSDFCETNTLSP